MPNNKPQSQKGMKIFSKVLLDEKLSKIKTAKSIVVNAPMTRSAFLFLLFSIQVSITVEFKRQRSDLRAPLNLSITTTAQLPASNFGSVNCSFESSGAEKFTDLICSSWRQA